MMIETTSPIIRLVQCLSIEDGLITLLDCNIVKEEQSRKKIVGKTILHKDKHYLRCQRDARFEVSLAKEVAESEW